MVNSVLNLEIYFYEGLTLIHLKGVYRVKIIWNAKYKVKLQVVLS